MSYRVEITDLQDKQGARDIADGLPEAVCEAVRGSRSYTLQAFIIGVIAYAVRDEVFPEADADRLLSFLKDIPMVPCNVQDEVTLALTGQ